MFRVHGSRLGYRLGRDGRVGREGKEEEERRLISASSWDVGYCECLLRSGFSEIEGVSCAVVSHLINGHNFLVNY